jgi:hypothetical protein
MMLGLPEKPNPYSLGSKRFTRILALSFVLMFGSFFSIFAIGLGKGSAPIAGAAFSILCVGVNLPIFGAGLDLLSEQSGLEPRMKAIVVWTGIVFAVGVIAYDAFLGIAGAYGILPFSWIDGAILLVLLNVFVMITVTVLVKRERKQP